MEDIKIAWRHWISMRVKIVDEYNRIPTRTQSALLTLLADGYAEILGQTIESPESAWFLTANDDMGGGTYQVIEALKDRIDIVIKALNFNPRFLSDSANAGRGANPPGNDRAGKKSSSPRPNSTQSIRPSSRCRFRRRCAAASSSSPPSSTSATWPPRRSSTSRKTPSAWRARRSHRSAPTIAGATRSSALCSQTENGLSVRSLLTLLHFVKALAWFRGQPEVSVADVRQIVPWILHEKLVPNLTSPFFDQSRLRHLPHRSRRLAAHRIRRGMRGVRSARPGPR